MKDRKPRHPGRVKLEPVAGRENVFDMTRADDPEDPGTPMNKQTLLTDEAAADVGLDPDGDYTPNDAFALIGKYTARKPGDILETVRTNHGDRWLLCNGDLVREGQYPKLREAMPYNTEWRIVAPLQDFDRVQAIYGKPGQWALIKSWNPGSSERQGKAAALYDARTDTVTIINCPAIQTESAYGIIGLSHDGDRYILGVGQRSNGALDVYYRCHLFVSDDLVNWTKARYFDTGTSHEPYDMIFDGTGTIVASQYYPYTGNTDDTYRVNVHYTNKEMTQTTQMSSSWRPKYLSDFSVLPNDYWTFQRDGNTYCSVYKSGAHRNVFSFSYNGGIAFFNDKYWIGTPNGNQYVRYIETYNFETGTKGSFTVESLFESSDTIYLRGVEYDKNTNEWMLYISGAANTDACYIAYISADADPNDLTQYRVVRVEALPELHNVQMAPDRSKMTAGNILRDPNQKYLPKHSGDTMKYIYTG